MTINVDKICEINQENIVPCRDRLIGINVIPKDRVEDGFINYCLAIENFQFCCEDYGSGIIIFKESKDRTYYVKTINHNIDCDLDWFKKILEDCDKYSQFTIDSITDECVVSTVLGENDELIAIGFVYNSHNGYYSHEVFTNINGEIEVTCM